MHVKETAADHDIVHRGIFRIIQDKRLPEAGQLDVCIASLQRFAELVHIRNRRDKGLFRHVVKDHSVQDVSVLVDLVLGIGPGRRSFRSGFAGRGRCRPYRVGTGRGIPRLSCIQHYARTDLSRKSCLLCRLPQELRCVCGGDISHHRARQHCRSSQCCHHPFQSLLQSPFHSSSPC